MPGNSNKTGEPLWYKDAVVYEVHVKSFYDSSGDGMGDFEGLVQKLDYLSDLGITAIWLLPFYPSPLKDDGYDIADYFNVNRDYGSLGDFRRFLRQAHKRGIRVITELVINHTSDQHKWFRRARGAKDGSAWRNYYVWSKTPDRYRDARIIFKDYEQSNWAWDRLAQAYYWHRFYSHQPDLNFDNPQVRKQILRVLDFWLSMGVDGLRLDAVPYLFEREGTNCENLEETHAFLKELRSHVDGRYADRMLLAEANQWPEDAAQYFGRGDECNMAFHFPVMPRLFMSVQMEDRFPIVNMIEQSMDIPDQCQWAMFLRNHDELTLEMVSDEERDYMYGAYARDPKARINLGIRRRLAPLLDNNRRKMELMNFLLFSLPGTPVLYYGDEIGMGDNYYLGDRDGVRTPMQWNSDRNAGFSRADPQQLYLPAVIDLQYHYTAVNVENQMSNPSSLLWFMRRLIAARNKFRAFGRGGMEFFGCDNRHVLGFVRRYADECVLVVANLSRFCQNARLFLDKYAGLVPEEVFGGSKFPCITDRPYTLSLGPHNTYWFALKRQAPVEVAAAGRIGRLQLDADWSGITREPFRSRLGSILPAYLKKSRWFGGKGRPIRNVEIVDSITVPGGKSPSHMLQLEVSYVGATRQTYLLPVSLAVQRQVLKVSRNHPGSPICELQLRNEQGLVYDGTYDRQLQDNLLNMITAKRTVKSGQSRLRGIRGSGLRRILAGKKTALEPRVLGGEQSNTAILYGDRFFLKLYRRPAAGPNPDEEISRCLTDYTDFTSFPSHAGSLQWQRTNSDPMVIGLLLEYVPNEGDAWTYSLDCVEQYLTHAAAQKTKPQDIELPRSIYEIRGQDIPMPLLDMIGPIYLEMISLLAKRTAELHIALASLCHDSQTVPEPFSLMYQKSVYQSMRALTLDVFAELENNLSDLDGETSASIKTVLDAKQEILRCFRRITAHRMSAMKIRIHGDYHLGQVLYTGKDFVIIDFEGEPARPLSERRLKRSALRDVAGMIRSFHYAAHGAVLLRPAVQPPNLEAGSQWVDLWYRCAAGTFLNSYLAAAGGADFIPADREDFNALLDAFLLQKAVYELGYELNNRPDWLPIPIKGIQRSLKQT